MHCNLQLHLMNWWSLFIRSCRMIFIVACGKHFYFIHVFFLSAANIKIWLFFSTWLKYIVTICGICQYILSFIGLLLTSVILWGHVNTLRGCDWSQELLKKRNINTISYTLRRASNDTRCFSLSSRKLWLTSRSGVWSGLLTNFTSCWALLGKSLIFLLFCIPEAGTLQHHPIMEPQEALRYMRRSDPNKTNVGQRDYLWNFTKEELYSPILQKVLNFDSPIKIKDVLSTCGRWDKT